MRSRFVTAKPMQSHRLAQIGAQVGMFLAVGIPLLTYVFHRDQDRWINLTWMIGMALPLCAVFDRIDAMVRECQTITWFVWNLVKDAESEDAGISQADLRRMRAAVRPALGLNDDKVDADDSAG
jgi:hypothetical protein